MFTPDAAFSGFSIDDTDAARTFYGDVLGLTVVDNPMGFLELELSSGARGCCTRTEPRARELHRAQLPRRRHR